MENMNSFVEVSILKEVWFSSMVETLRNDVMCVLSRRFGRLRWEDLEEVYMDGCLVVYWNLLNGKVELDGEGFVKYLTQVCKNVGMHYLRNVKEGVLSVEEMMDRSFYEVYNCDDVIDEMMEVIDDEMSDEEEKLARLGMAWSRLSDVDRMILECYYWEEMSMEEIMRKIGYKSVASVKNKKSVCLKKMLKVVENERVEVSGWNGSSYCWLPEAV